MFKGFLDRPLDGGSYQSKSNSRGLSPLAIGEFNARDPRDQESIVDHVPHASGVYAIFDSEKWIYVGEAADIQTELLRYLNRDSPPLTGNLPTVFQFELVAAAQRVARQDQLISVLRPARNHKSTS
jgi:hypothetical protein